MSEARAAQLGPKEKPDVPESATGLPKGKRPWTGPTYYGRSQLKAAPFNRWVVGGYVALAGMCGSSALLSAVADLVRGDSRETAGVVRRGRYLALLAPTLGSALLIWDLHTPQRFYNMLRVAKHTSPMSIGTWILMSFTAFSGIAAVAQFIADRVPGLHWMRGAARVGAVPAAAAGAGLSTYTAALLAATSTPLWAAAPRSLAVRFGSSSFASGAAALSLAERSGRTGRALDQIALAALAVELAGAASSHAAYKRKGVDAALDGPWGHAEKLGATGMGIVLPLGLYAASLAFNRHRSHGLSRLASAAVLGGSFLLRVSIMGAGDKSANEPEISLRFAQPENLPG
ncbi:MAG: polysulfide reductase NrfD [Acetobacteraceae bacterium]|nr:polysulfide reductase NrfD [Acetobacteraceae bacterium]